jgi:hypothetical protein
MPNTYTLIASYTVGAGGAANITFSSIPGTYTDLVLHTSVRSSVSGYGTDMNITLNGSTSSFSSRRIYGYSGTVYTDTQTNVSGVVNGGSSTGSIFASNYLYFPSYSGSTNKSYYIDGVIENNSTTAYLPELSANLWSNTAAITSIAIADNTGATLQQYSTAYLYGIKKS